MIYSRSKHFLYCHNPKTGGTSLRESLKPYTRPEEQSWAYKLFRRSSRLSMSWPFYDFLNHPHTTLAKAHLIIPSQVWQALFIYGVIREPVEWIASCYRHYLAYRNENPGERFLAECDSFDSYLNYCRDLGPYRPCQAFMFLSNDGSLLADLLSPFTEISSMHERIVRNHELSSNGLKSLNINKCYPPGSFEATKAQLRTIQEVWEIDFVLEELVQRSRDRPSLRGLELPAQLLPLINLECYDPWGAILSTVKKNSLL